MSCARSPNRATDLLPAWLWVCLCLTFSGCKTDVELIPCWPRCGGDAAADQAGMATCDDGDPCTQNDRSVDGVCKGELIDGDGDGHAPTSCGGKDCDDQDPGVSPDGVEGPFADLCKDGKDNDCNGLTDHQDPVCTPNTLCSRGGWCWELPATSNNTLNAVWAVASDNVWAVGMRETLLHFDGVSWSGVVLSRGNAVVRSLHDIWAGSADDLWISGDTRLLRFDGAGFSGQGVKPRTNLGMEVWGFSSGEIFAGGGFNQVFTRAGPGADWALSLDEVVQDMWGAAPDDLWAISSSGKGMHHYDGASWSSTDLPTGPMHAIWGLARDDIWAVGDKGATVHYDGASWQAISTPLTEEKLRSVWGASADDVWAGGHLGTIMRLQGGAWKEAHKARAGLLSIHGASASDVWAVGIGGLILHFDGKTWTEKSSPDYHRVHGLWASGPSDAWAVTDKEVLSFDGETWSRVPAVPLDQKSLIKDVWGSGPDDVWVVQSRRVLRFDGKTWTNVPCPTIFIRAIWGSASDDIWAVGGSPWHFDGKTWTMVSHSDAGGLFADVHGTGPDDVWAVEYDKIYHYDGKAWSLTTKAGEIHGGLETVWAVAPGEAWAGGFFGLLYFNGQRWISTGPNDHITALWGRSPHEIWALGRRGMIYYYNGKSWQRENSGALGPLEAMWGTSEGDVWIGGWNQLLHKR